jgi:ATP-dependent Lhr-like helicase
VIRDGELAGMVEKWEMSGAVELREMDLIDPGILPDVLGACDRMMDFYRQRRFEVLRVTQVLRTPVPELSNALLKPFATVGYHRIGDFLAKGDFVPRDFAPEDVLAHVFWRQGLHPDTRFDTPADAARALGGLRSDFASRLRVRAFTPLDKLRKQGVLLPSVGIPAYVTYATMDQLGVFQKAKAVSLSAAMRDILRIVREEQPATRLRVHQQSSQGYAVTSAALRRLVEGNYVTRDSAGRYLAIPPPKMDAERARLEVFRTIFRAFGIFSAENLSAYTRFEYSMADVRRLLRALEDEGILVKGFFLRGERTLYWMLKEDVDRVGSIPFRERFVLTMWDNLSTYLRRQMSERWEIGASYLVFDGANPVAAFKAKKRKWQLSVSQFVGEPKARAIVAAWADANDVAVVEESGRIADDEIMEWYEKMYGRGAAK